MKRAKQRYLKQQRSFVNALLSMPNVGEDDDFSRNRGYMGERAYLKALTMDGSPGDKILGAMIDQLNKSSASAEAAIDWALLEIDASNRRIQAVRRDENFKAT